MKINIQHIAKLANLEISLKNSLKIESQLTSILNHIEILNKLDTKSIEETSQVTGLISVERIDKVSKSLKQDSVLSSAKKTFNGFFEVDSIFD